jgi:hypothetical protein
MDSYSKNYGDSKPPKKRSTIYSKPFKCPVVTLKKNTLGIPSQALGIQTPSPRIPIRNCKKG